MVARKHLKLRKKAKHPPRGAAAGVPAPSANNLLHAYKREFVEWGSTLGLSPRTADTRAHGLEVFIAWCDERGLTRPQDITRPILQRYQRHLFHYRKRDGDPLAFTTQANMLQPLRAFFKWLTVENHILYNPAADLMIPKIPRQLPKVLLTIEEIEQVLAAPDLDTPTGLRNRAMMETLYSTGLRRSEPPCTA
jgi:integrase/recombinase XerD